MKRLFAKWISILLTLFVMSGMAGFFVLKAYAIDVTLINNTVVGLQDEINNASSAPTTIVISAGFSFNGKTVSIPSNKNITIKSDMGLAGAPFTLTQNTKRHFTVNGTLTLEDIILDGSSNITSTVSSGGVEMDGASAKFAMNNGAVIQSCYYNGSGGAVLMGDGLFTMNGGTITNNVALSGGGGVCMANTGCTFNMYGGVITGNTAKGSLNAGGGVFARGSFHMYDGEISKNTAAASGANGGGVLVYNNSTFIMGDSSGSSTGNPVISGNTSPVNGGGVYISSGTFTMYSGEIKNNKAASGGGVYSIGNTFTMSGGAIEWNEAAAGNGGGVCTGTNFEITISGGTISNNKASANGGGIYVNSSSSAPSMLTVTDGEISDNTALAGAGICGDTGSKITLEGGNIRGNKAASGGGGVSVTYGKLTMKDGAVIQNCTADSGGGLFSTGSSITIYDGTINGCKATCGGGVYLTGLNGTFSMYDGDIGGYDTGESNEAGYGGGLYAVGTNNRVYIGGDATGPAAEGNPKINGNTARYYGGGVSLGGTNLNAAMYRGEINGNKTTEAGIFGVGAGGMHIRSGAGFVFSGGTISSNKTSKNGGGVFVNGGSLTMNGTSAVTGNTAEMNGGGIYGNTNEAGVGGTITVNSGAISGNEASSGAANSYGGGVYLSGSSFVMGAPGGSNDSVLIQNNKASYMGGGVDAHDGSSFTMNCGTISGNKALSGGALTYAGGVEVYNGSTFTMKDGVITENASSDFAGGVEVYNNSMFTMDGGSITENTAPNGGGVSVGYQSAVFNMNGGEVRGNTAARYGGGAYVYSSGVMNVTSGSISGNDAAYGGGVFTAETGRVNINNCPVTGNTAAADGGGIYTMDRDYNNLTTGGSTAFDGNTAASSYVPGGDLDNMYPSIRYSSVSGSFSHPLNNFDINTNFDIASNCHVTFDSQGGTGVPDQIVEYGDRVTEPADPTKTGYGFDGWWTETADGELWNFDTVLVEEVHGTELVLYAHWKAQPTIVSGTVSGLPDNSGVMINWSIDGGSATGTAVTDEGGNYSFEVPYDSNLSILPSAQAGYSVGPANINITVAAETLAGNDFLYTPLSANPPGGTAPPDEEEIEDTNPPLGNFPEDHTVYLNGYPDESVKADNAITRAEVAAIFFRLIDDSNKTQSLPRQFEDVKDDLWCAQYINYLAGIGVLNGSPDGMFRPNDAITRAEYSNIVSKLNGLSFNNTVSFTDVDSSHPAYEQICAAYSYGWINRFPDGTFRPDQTIDRSQVVEIINTQLDRMIDMAALSKVKNPYKDITISHPAYADIMEASIEHEYKRDKDGTEIWTTG